MGGVDAVADCWMAGSLMGKGCGFWRSCNSRRRKLGFRDRFSVYQTKSECVSILS